MPACERKWKSICASMRARRTGTMQCFACVLHLIAEIWEVVPNVI